MALLGTHAHRHKHRRAYPNTQCPQHTHVLTHVHTHTLIDTAESTQVSRGCHAPRLLSSARGASEPWRSVQLSILSLCPLGLPQGTGYQWPPLHLPPWREKWLHRAPAQLPAWCLSGPRDPASLEMSPGPQGPGCRGQANPQSLPSPLPGSCPSTSPRQDTMRPAFCKSLTLSPDLTSRFPGEDALDLGAGGGSLAAQAPGEGRPPGSAELPAGCGPCAWDRATSPKLGSLRNAHISRQPPSSDR